MEGKMGLNSVGVVGTPVNSVDGTHSCLYTRVVEGMHGYSDLWGANQLGAFALDGVELLESWWRVFFYVLDLFLPDGAKVVKCHEASLLLQDARYQFELLL